MATKTEKEPLKFPLNNSQLELLRVLSMKLRRSEEKELAKLINDFADRVAQARVDEAVEKGHWVKLQKAR
jgi:hypothetical protein